MYIVIFRPHGMLHCETKYYGTFVTYESAYEFICTLPALGTYKNDEDCGVKHIVELTPVPHTK